MLAFEGVRKYGQRVFKVADLTAIATRLQGLLGTKKPKAQFWSGELTELSSLLLKDYFIIGFETTRKACAIMKTNIETDVRDLPARFQLVPSGQSYSKGEKEKLVLNCTKWIIKIIENALGFEIPHANGYVPSKTVINLMNDPLQIDNHPVILSSQPGDYKLESFIQEEPGEASSSCMVM